MIAAIELGFDPLLHLGELVVRWQTIGVTVALLAAIGWAAVRVPATDPATDPARRRPDSHFPDAPGFESPRSGPLRLEDLLLLVLGVVPGAVVGGRLVQAVVYFDAYSANPASIIDPRVGSLSLLGAVLGGLASSLYLAHLLRAPIARWAALAAEPLLLALALGKLAQLLGGSGQGLPFDGPWAVAFIGDGPWVSANAAVASHPSQVYEGIWLLIGIPLVRRLAPRLAGLPLLAAVAWFFAGRVVVGFTWRDPTPIGPLNVEQVIGLGCLALTLLLAYRVIVDVTKRTTAPRAREPSR